jgi:hypothetical protein
MTGDDGLFGMKQGTALTYSPCNRNGAAHYSQPRFQIIHFLFPNPMKASYIYYRNMSKKRKFP